MTVPDFTAQLLFGVLAGLVGTGGMTGVMTLIDRLGITNAKMVVAIGTLVTKSRARAVRVGLVIHLAAGVCFALVYTAAFVLLQVEGFWPSVGAGTIAGFVHGFAMSFILVVVVAEHHPLSEFRDAGFGVAAAHLVGHVVYGALVGLVLGTTALLT